MSAKKTAKDYLEEIAPYGYTGEDIKRMYEEEHYSKNAIAVEINNKIGKSTLYKKSINDIFAYLKISERTPAEAQALSNAKRAEKATYGKSIGASMTAEDIVEAYNNGLSITQIYSMHGVSPQITKRILSENNIEIRKQIEYKDVLEKMEEKGISRETLEKWYLVENMSSTELIAKLSKELDINVGEKALAKVFNHYNLRKSAEQIRQVRTAMSARIKAQMMDELKIAGHNSLEDLALYYQNSKHTYESLLEELNSKAPSAKFTRRWLERHMTPLLPKDREFRVSRVEMNVEQYLRSKVGEDVLIIPNDRAIIAPLELDLYVPSLNLAIEVNGDYWHSDRFLQENHGMSAHEYHRNKYLACQAKGITLLFIWESHWAKRNEELKQALDSYLESGVVDPVLLQLTA